MNFSDDISLQPLSTNIHMKDLHLLLLTPLCCLLCSCPGPTPNKEKQVTPTAPIAKVDEKLISFKGIKAKVPKSTTQEQTMNEDGYELLSMTIDGYLVKFAQLHQDPETGKDYQSVYNNFKSLNLTALEGKPVRTLNGQNTLVEYYRFNGLAIGVIKHEGAAILRFTFTGKGDPQSQEQLDAQNKFFDGTIKPILRSTVY